MNAQRGNVWVNKHNLEYRKKIKEAVITPLRCFHFSLKEIKSQIVVYMRPNMYNIFKIKTFKISNLIKLTPHHFQPKFHNRCGV